CAREPHYYYDRGYPEYW
nr:immunoglobulin heavy chain junction region [Macaca mulatta]